MAGNFDPELRFIASLLRGTPQEQDQFYTQQIPLGVFKLRQQEMLWIQRYREKHGQYPSRIAAQIHFGEKVPKIDEPVSACLQPVLDRCMYDEMKKVVNKVKGMTDEGLPMGQTIAAFKDGASRVKDFSVDYVDSDFAKSKGSINRYRELVRLKSDPKAQLLDFPWPTMNKLIGFQRPGNTFVWAARTSIGKTWVTTCLFDHYASKGISSLYITKEMPTEEIEDRFEAIRFELPYENFRAGTLPGDILRRWRKERAHADSYPLIICGDETIEGTGLNHVLSKIEQYRPKIVCVDGAYLLRPENMPKNTGTVERLAFISSRIKVIAKVTKTVIHVVVQLNRSAEDKTGNTKGSISSIYGADTWAQDADYVATIGGKRGGTSRLIALLKGRESNVGEFYITFGLSPRPNFSENKTLTTSTTTTGSQVKFKGIK